MVEEEKDIVVEPPEGVIIRGFNKEGWIPKTDIGRKVKSGEIKSIEEVLAKGVKILEPQIIDMLVPELQSTLLSIGQSKGKFCGGKKSIWRQTQKKTKKGKKTKNLCFFVILKKKKYFFIII